MACTLSASHYVSTSLLNSLELAVLDQSGHLGEEGVHVLARDNEPLVPAPAKKCVKIVYV